jgi:uncharacterized damage-inducible protein DinB
MKDRSYLLELAQYNVWANEKYAVLLNEISEEQWSAPVVSSFGSIGATALHIASAERIWLDRLHGVAAPVWLVDKMQPERQQTLAEWHKASAGLKDLVEKIDPESLEDPFPFRRINGEFVTLIRYQALVQVLNHSTYHRGQLQTMIKQVGHDRTVSTDIMIFYRTLTNV